MNGEQRAWVICISVLAAFMSVVAICLTISTIHSHNTNGHHLVKEVQVWKP